jgi:hypothetical protein
MSSLKKIKKIEKGFVEHVKSALGALAKGRKARESGDRYQEASRALSALWRALCGQKRRYRA